VREQFVRWSLGLASGSFSRVLLLEIQYVREGELNHQHERPRQGYSGRTTYSPIHHESKSQTAAASDSVRADRVEPSEPFKFKISNSIYLDDHWDCARKCCHRVGPRLSSAESAPGMYGGEQYCSLQIANVDCRHRCTVICTLPSRSEA
jgi:hypothetical protein